MSELYGQNLHGMAVSLQEQCDSHLLDKINQAGLRMEDHSNTLTKFRDFIVQLQAYRGDEADIDLTPMQDKIDQFLIDWESLRDEYPFLEESPIPPNLDLAKLSTHDLDMIERRVDNMVTRLQNNYPKMMLEIEMHTNLHKLISDIMMQISKSHIDTGRIYTRNQRSN